MYDYLKNNKKTNKYKKLLTVWISWNHVIKRRCGWFYSDEMTLWYDEVILALIAPERHTYSIMKVELRAVQSKVQGVSDFYSPHCAQFIVMSWPCDMLRWWALCMRHRTWMSLWKKYLGMKLFGIQGPFSCQWEVYSFKTNPVFPYAI